MPDTELTEGMNLDGRLLLIAPVGRGGQATVWKVRELDGAKRELAAKLVVVPKARRAEISEQVIDGEIQKLRVLSSNFIVVMYYAIYVLMEDSGDVVVGYTMPLASGTLQSDNEYRKNLRANKDDLFDTMWNIGQGISTIHYNNFVHGDIKPSNVLLFTERDQKSARVSDLGAAYLASLGFGVAFDPRYAAPERFKSQYETANADKKKSDIYSLGLLYYELITDQYAYGNVHVEFPLQDFQRIHETRSVDWELIPKTYGSLVDTLQKMVDKDPAERPDISDVIRKLDSTRSIAQVETTQGVHRKAEIFFTPNVFIWNPRLHRKFEYRKKIFFIKSPRPFELASAIRSTLRKEFPRWGFTSYVAFGSADIVLMAWEPEKQDAIGAAIRPLVLLAQGTIEVYVVENVIYRDSRPSETWEREPSSDLARRIAAHTAPEIESALARGQEVGKALEPWLRKQRLVFNTLVPADRHGMVRLLLKIDANKPMIQEHNSVVDSMLNFLKTHYSQGRGKGKNKLTSYPYRVYRDVTFSGDWGSIKNRYLFAELFGPDIYHCSSAIVGLITSIGQVPVSNDQFFLFSSHIQFDQQNVVESEDGALSEILSAGGVRK